MIKQDTLELDDVVYHFSEADFFKAESHARKLLNFADGLIEVKMIENDEGNKVPDFEINLGAVLGNLSGSEFDKIRDFIFDTIKVVDNGEGVLFSNKTQQGQHFSKYRSHYTQVLIAGLKFHFLAFLPNGEQFAKTIFGQALNKAAAKMQG